mmetsp:Transcript_40036/g.86440  ORF Transcript_40036/g.86440 Transcript_40036/m.86440 type:complete len:154 (-) Transcript_40036:15-476(-)
MKRPNSGSFDLPHHTAKGDLYMVRGEEGAEASPGVAVAKTNKGAALQPTEATNHAPGPHPSPNIEALEGDRHRAGAEEEEEALLRQGRRIAGEVRWAVGHRSEGGLLDTVANPVLVISDHTEALILVEAAVVALRSRSASGCPVVAAMAGGGK